LDGQLAAGRLAHVARDRLRLTRHAEIGLQLRDERACVGEAEGIARVSCWANGSDFPDWNVVLAALVKLGLDPGATQRWLRDLGERAAALTPILRECGAPDAVIARCEDRTARVARALGAVSA
jgi:hypothetical protein